MTNPPNQATDPRLLRFHRDEDGMIVWGVLVSILFFLVVTAFVYNSGKTVAKKIETQNSADAMAYSGSVWSARSMNTITATNHLVGELNSLYVMHHALGGYYLDNFDDFNDRTYEMRLADLSLAAAVLNLGDTLNELTGIDIGPLSEIGLNNLPFLGHEGYDEIREGTYSDLNSALFLAKLTLKGRMLLLYLEHDAKLVDLIVTIGEALFYAATVLGIPIAIGKVGEAIDIINDIQDLRDKEQEIADQYERLTKIEEFARSIRGAKKAIPGVISLLHNYQRLLVAATPVVVRSSVEEVAEKHNTTGFVSGNSILPIAPLPVERELEFNQLNEDHSQMVRATYPWVVYWRKFVGPALTVAAPDSFVGFYYAVWSENYTLQASEWLRNDTNQRYKNDLTVDNHRTNPISLFINNILGKPSISQGENGKDIRLYVVKGLNEAGGVKGDEPWNDDNSRQRSSENVDDFFCMFAVAKSKEPSMAATSFFRQENPKGVVCFAQSMIYNANEKRMLTGGGGGFLGIGKDRQPRETWDTLNFIDFVPEYESTGFLGQIGGSLGDFFTGFSQPEVRLNWQAKLTPVTDRRLRNGAITARIGDRDSFDVLAAGREGLLLLQNH